MRRLALALALATVLAACGGGETVAPLPETVEGTVPTATETGENGGNGEATVPEGDADAGREVFLAAGCGSCHTMADAGTTSEVGPNLDESLEGRDAEFVHESIVDPDAEVAEGFSPDVMPENYEEQLSEQELADLVAFLLPER